MGREETVVVTSDGVRVTVARQPKDPVSGQCVSLHISPPISPGLTEAEAVELAEALLPPHLLVVDGAFVAAWQDDEPL
jgi:hypothetical protein